MNYPRSFRSLLFVAILGALAPFCAAQSAAPINQTGHGLQLGTRPDQGLGFYGVAPVSQRSGSSQAAVTKTTGAALATTASTQTTPFGFATQAQADALTSRINQLVADNANLVTLVNELRAALVAQGLIKGAP